MITDSPQLTELRRFAISRGMRTLSRDGLQKAEKGLTTIEEIMRVTES